MNLKKKTKKTVLIAAPTYKREWILPTWLECMEQQSIGLENLKFIFELGPDDKPTHEILWEWQTRHPEVSFFDPGTPLRVNHNTHESRAQKIAEANGEEYDPNGMHRTWTHGAYMTMVELRNNLLKRASCLEFDHYFSLDTDILLEDPYSIERLIEYNSRPEIQVVSPLCYMTPFSTDYPNIMTWDRPDGFMACRMPGIYPNPIDSVTIFRADIVMAAVMMTPYVVRNIEYVFHPQGEDLGFALSLRDAGIDSYLMPKVYCPHIMHKNLLEDYLTFNKSDPRRPNMLAV